MKRWLVALLLANVVVAAVVIGRAQQTRATVPSAAAVQAYADGRVEALDLTAAERRWERIGWGYDVDEALRLSREHRRPIFLYAVNGPLDGRC